MVLGRPSGTVSFLFTDVEGSTRLWEEHPESMKAALALHDETLQRVISDHHGHVFSTAGDAFCAAFHRVRDAIGAAIAGQRELAAVEWPTPGPLRVRMGVHTGEADERNGDYFGPVVNRVARIMDAGHGGQILLSDLTASLASDIERIDLGSHLLKSLDEPVAIHQVVVPGGPASFPPLRTVGVAASTIRQARGALVGRVADVVRLHAAVASNRLVTVTGAGGVGKTRLALEVANAFVGRVSGGVAFADLSKVSDDTLVTSALAEGMDLSIGASSNAASAVRQYVADREMLLVVDNCEHVIDEVADRVDELLATGSDLRILATSREALALDGEHVVALRGMAPEDAVELFCHAAGRPMDGWTSDDRRVIEEICRRLDGLPLAIQLAAARTSVLAVEEIAAHLDDRFTMLTGGRRRTRGRTQTLLATVQWSFDLLEPDQQDALAALSVMPGSFGLELASGVLDRTEMATVDALEDLAARSLLQADVDDADPHGRYRLLETIRAFAADQLRAGPHEDIVRRRHLDTVVALLGEQQFFSSSEQMRLGDDALAAFDWARHAGRVAEGSRISQTVVEALMLGGAPTRAIEAVEWAATVDDPEQSAQVWARGAWVGVLLLDASLIHRCGANGIQAAPGSPGAALCQATRATAWNFTSPDRAAADIEAARAVIEIEGSAMDVLWLRWAESSSLLFADRADLALPVLRDWIDRSAETGHTLDALARSSLAAALICLEAHDELQVEVERGHNDSPIRGAMEEVLEYGHRAWIGTAMAHLGDVDGGRRSVAALWAERPDHGIPFVDTNVAVALAECAHLAGEPEVTQRLLDASDYFARDPGAEVIMYWRLADLAGVARADRRAWAAEELVRRYTRDHTTDRAPVALAVNEELRRLGLR